MENEVFNNLLAFAKAWNAGRSYPTWYDLSRKLGLSEAELRKKADDYHEQQKDNPKLPELIWRRGETGQVVPVPQRALRQLDRFRIDRKRLAKAPGVIVTAAQFGANIHQDFWRALKDRKSVV